MARMDDLGARADRIGYVVITFNQASRLPGLPVGACLYDRLEDAVSARNWERSETAKIGRRETHVVAEVIELEEDE
jgi:hypothetical protein